MMLQQNCQGTRVAADSIGMGSYTMDSHNCQRIVQGGWVRNEGDVQPATPAPYPISYRSIVPRVGGMQKPLRHVRAFRRPHGLRLRADGACLYDHQPERGDGGGLCD